VTTSLPLIHPAAILRGSWEQDPLQVEYLERAKAYVNGTIDPIDINTAPADACMYPTLQDLTDWEVRQPLAGGISIDIESAGEHVICVGLLCVPTGSYICVRFRLAGGQTYWPTFWDTYRAVEWLDSVLSNPDYPKVFHNGQAFDVPELSILGYAMGEGALGDLPRPYGFNVAGFGTHPLGMDTMLAQQTALSGFPKGLAQCATYHLGMPSWKKLVKEDEETDGKA